MNRQANQSDKRKQISTRDRSKQGAAMMAVMLILLLATATAAVTVESTGFEAKASGYNRMAVQVKNISEAGLVRAIAQMDFVFASGLQKAMMTASDDKVDAFNNSRPVDEPPLKYKEFGYRIKYNNFVSENTPFLKENVLGLDQGYDIDFTVDIYDAYYSNRLVPGYTAHEDSPPFLQLTYIARGQLKFGDERQIEHVSCACVEAEL